MRFALLLLLAWPAAAVPITGRAASSWAAAHGWWITGPDFYLYSGRPHGPSSFAECPTGGQCELRGSIDGYMDVQRWGAHYKGQEINTVNGQLDLVASALIPTAAERESLAFAGVPFTFSGWIKGWASAGPDAPPTDPGPLVVEMMVSGAGTMHISGIVEGGRYNIQYMEAFGQNRDGLSGDAVVIFEAGATPGAVIPEVSRSALLVIGLAMLGLRSRQDARARVMF